MTTRPDHPTGRHTALIVSADAAIRDVYIAAAAPIVDELECAEDGREALVKTIRTLPTVVLTDEQLPFFNGDILCSLLRNDPLTSDVHVVVITLDLESMLRRGRQCGADRVLAAPVEPHVLSGAISDTLHQKTVSRMSRCDTLDDGGDRNQAAALDGHAGRHPRFETSSTPPAAPPLLRCPSCDQLLRYTVSHIGGPVRSREQ